MWELDPTASGCTGSISGCCRLGSGHAHSDGTIPAACAITKHNTAEVQPQGAHAWGIPWGHHTWDLLQLP